MSSAPIATPFIMYIAFAYYLDHTHSDIIFENDDYPFKFVSMANYLVYGLNSGNNESCARVHAPTGSLQNGQRHLIPFVDHDCCR